ncbi:MAG: helix-turn-helix transcriptional regulator [bacterium]
MNKRKASKLKSFDEHLDIEYGKIGTIKRNNYEKELESFKLGITIKEARNFRQLTQEALALKSGTTKFYISRIENNGSDIRLSTLMKIVQDGLGGKLKFSVDFDEKNQAKKV